MNNNIQLPSIKFLLNSIDTHTTSNNSNNNNSNNNSNSNNNNNNKITKKQYRYTLPKRCVSILNEWLMDHLNNPYPTAQEKTDLLIKTGLTKIQLSNWFINQRRRKIFNNYYSMVQSLHNEKDTKQQQQKPLFTKRKKLIDRIDELKQLTNDTST
ncbi:hypothetical protein MOSE0_K10242 [Monosporozyma servazzii]